MSYISAVRDNNTVIVWERKNGVRFQKTFKAPYYFYVEDPNGEYTSIFKQKLRREDFEDSYEFNQARMKLKDRKVTLFESDIPPELKILSQHYYEKPIPNLHVTFFDIEVDYDKNIGFSSVSNPYAPINSIALYHSWSNRMVVYAIPPKEYSGPTDEDSLLELMSKVAPLPENTNIELYMCQTERELLIAFLNEIEDSDVISGWNSNFFDVPYIGKRLELIGGYYFNKLSFMGAGKPKWKTVERMKKEAEILEIFGRASADYMELFQKYEMAERPSYKLESIANEFLPDLPKLEYEGSLADLYRKDFVWFIRYNLRDTEILRGFEDVLGYIGVANQMYHISTGLFQHVTGTLKLAELATINFCHNELDKIVNDNLLSEDDDNQIQGAFVLIPQIGLHKKGGSIDIKSLYPSSIIGINISLETLMGQFVENVRAYEEIKKRSDVELTLILDEGRHELTYPAKVWREKLIKIGWSVSGYGTVFNQNEKGIIPSILSSWYKERKKYQGLSKQFESEADDLLKIIPTTTNVVEREGVTIDVDVATQYDDLMQKSIYYDKLQYVFKIKLNSFYGALTNKYFRFFDKRMGESTTGTGRMILLHQCSQVCEILDGEYVGPDVSMYDEDGNLHVGYSSKWSVIYGDTDSAYFKTRGETIEEAILIADKVGELVNKSFPAFMRDSFLCRDGYDNAVGTSREVVFNQGIFVDKKRYFLNIVDKEGKRVDTLKIMGLDTKKTTLPREVANVINQFVGRFLRGEDWDDMEREIVDYKHQLETSNDILSIGLPKGIQGIEEYTMAYQYDNKTRLPGHVAASIFYNKCLEQYNDKLSPIIVSGMKIKVFYLKQKQGRFKSIALPVDIECIPEWFREFSIDRKAHVTRLVDNPINNIIKAIGRESPSEYSLLVKEWIEF